MSRMGIIRGLIRNTGLGLNKPINPLTAFYGGEMALAPIGTSIARDLGIMDPIRDPQREFEREQRIKSAQFASALRGQRLRAQTERNLAIIRQQAPDIYNSVSAGRRVPDGAVVLGGRPRQDLLLELAQHMGSSQPNPSLPF